MSERAGGMGLVVAGMLASSLLGSAVLSSACNNITGAAGLRVGPDDGGPPSADGGESASAGGQGVGGGAPNPSTVGSSGPSSSHAATSGAGAGPASATAAASTSAATSGSGGDPATSAASSSASSTAATSGSGGAVAWPAGPYGVAQGNTVPQGLSWPGYGPGMQATTINLNDWYDPDGSRGIGAILIDTSQFGCGPCYQEAQDLEGDIANWKQQGLKIRIITLVINDENGNSADQAAAGAWQKKFSLSDVWVGADPNVTFNCSGTPQEVVIDPRTMKIVSVDEGYSGDFSTLEGVAKKNK